jgi:hypothetical protein
MDEMNYLQLGAIERLATNLNTAFAGLSKKNEMETDAQVIRVVHESNGPAKINVKVEKNTKGYNYEATVTGGHSVAEAMAILREAMTKLAEEYGD